MFSWCTQTQVWLKYAGAHDDLMFLLGEMLILWFHALVYRLNHSRHVDIKTHRDKKGLLAKFQTGMCILRYKVDSSRHVHP